MKLHLLLAHAESGRPVLEKPVSLESLSREDPPPSLRKPTHLFDSAAEGDSLPKQRWALVVPEGKEGERVKSILAPLIKLREEQQGAPVSIYDAPRGLTAESAREFRSKRMQPSSGSLHAEARYVLLAGGLDAIPKELQDELTDDGSGYIGRLAFDTDESYEAYVDKIVRSENRAPATSMAQRAVFLSVDDDFATECGQELLVTPVARLCQDERKYGRFPTNEPVVQETLPAGSSARLLELARASGARVFFTMSHGRGAPVKGWKSAEDQRQSQGAMSLGRGVFLTPEEVGRGAFMSGGFWFYFACLGAGTPLQSVYLPWMKRLAQNKEEMTERDLDGILKTRPQDGRPFMTALTQAALANPDGPLAIIAHLDLAWSCSFYDAREASSHPNRFVGVLSHLVNGRRAGLALNLMSRYALQVDGALRKTYQAEEETPLSEQGSASVLAQRARLMMERHDLMQYVLLGDPAARLALGHEGGRAAIAPRATEPRELASPGLLPEEAMEDAVLAMISGASPYELAEKCGMSPEVLRQWTRAYREAGRAALRTLQSR
jgi:hypothetical protein